MRVQLPLAVTVLLAGVAPSLAASARAHHAILARSYYARRDSCVCPGSSSGGGSDDDEANDDDGSSGSVGSSGSGSGSGVSAAPAVVPAFTSSSAPNAIGLRLPSGSRHSKKRRRIPKVQPSQQSLQGGVSQAIQDLVNQGIINSTYGQQLSAAFNQSISQNTHTTTAPPSAVDGPNNVVWVQQKDTTAPTNSSAVAGASPSPSPSGAASSSNNSMTTAILNIQQAIQDALNAATLAESNLNASTQAQLKSCLNTILSNGGLPSNYSCISSSGSTPAGLQQTLNNILEQFLGILPNKILQSVFDAVSPQLTTLLPDEQTLVSNIEASIKSITAQATGGSVTALEQLGNCYSQAIQANGNVSYANCFLTSGAYDTMQTNMNTMLEQFIGVLPPNLINAVQNLVAYNLGTTNNASDATVYQQLNNAILSVGASLSGSAVTQYEAFEVCARKLLVEGDAAGAKNCTTGPATTQAGSTLVNSWVQQFEGYVPASLLADLASAVQGLNGTTNTAAIDQALHQAFDNANIGSGYVSCFEQIQACVVSAVESSGSSNATCGGPVSGCERIGASGSAGLAPIAPILSTSAAAMVSSVAVQATSTPVAAASVTPTSTAAAQVEPSSTLAKASSTTATSSVAAASKI